MPVFLRKSIATCDFPVGRGGVGTPCPLPLDQDGAFYAYLCTFRQLLLDGPSHRQSITYQGNLLHFDV